MKINSIKAAPYFGAGRINNSKKEQQNKRNNINPLQLCSKKAADALSAIHLFAAKKTPKFGKIPTTVVKNCQTGEKGKILDKKTGRKIHVAAVIQQDKNDTKLLTVYEKEKPIGEAKFSIGDKEHPHLYGFDEYIADDNVLYIEYMRSLKKGSYSHVGTLLHRLLHKISKDSGCRGKMILQSLDSAAPFHYDSGFRPRASLNPKDAYEKKEAELIEIQMIKGQHSGSVNMFLPKENMKKLEQGKHTTPPEIKDLSEEEYVEKVDEIIDTIKDISVWNF